MTLILEQWHVDMMTEIRRKFGSTFTSIIRYALKNSGKVAEKAVSPAVGENCHLVRFSIDAKFNSSSAEIRKALSAVLPQMNQNIDHNKIKSEIRNLDAQIADFFRSYASMEYIVKENENE